MTKELKFICEWDGEPGAGLLSGREDVTIRFSYGYHDSIPEEVVEHFRETLKELYDGARVETAEEYAEALAKEEAHYEELGKQL